MENDEYIIGEIPEKLQRGRATWGETSRIPLTSLSDRGLGYSSAVIRA